ncbi:hypothetical protein DV735_g2198, partial [Chaetothyriales sp. CBS 134920]
MASAAQLSSHDSHVLNLLFDAESTQPSEQSSHGEQKYCETELQIREKAILTTLNLDKPDGGTIDAAINNLTELIMENPDYASAYNNRAQARRMRHGDDALLTDLEALAEIVKDLAAAIKLSTPQNDRTVILSTRPSDPPRNSPQTGLSPQVALLNSQPLPESPRSSALGQSKFDPVEDEVLQQLAETYKTRLASQGLFLFDVHKLPSLVSSFNSLLSYSFLALLVRFANDPFYHNVKDSATSFYARTAKSMLFGEMESSSNALQVLQSLCLLAYHDILDSKPGSVFTTLGIASRYAILKDILQPSTSQRPLLSANYEDLSRCCWNLFYLDRIYGTSAPSTSTAATLFNELALPELPASITHREIPPTSTASLVGEAPDTGPQSDLGIGHYALKLVSMWAMLMGYLKQTKLNTNQPDPWMPNSAYNEVASQIFVFETIFPHRHRFNRVKFQERSVEDISRWQRYWEHWLLMQFLYHAFQAILNHPFLQVLRTRDDSRRGQPQPPSFLQHTVDQVTLHSRWITRLIDLCSDKSFLLANPFLGHITGAMATVQFFFCFSTDAALANSGADNFKKYHKVVGTMAEDWPHLKHTDEKLNKLAEIIPQLRERRNSRQLPRVSEGLIWSLLDYAASSSLTNGSSDQSGTVDVNMDVQYLSPPNAEASSADDLQNVPRGEGLAPTEPMRILDDTLTLDLQSLLDIRGEDEPENPRSSPVMGRVRPSLAAIRFNQIRQIGGPNSIDNFAKSWQRAAGFREITPVRRNSIIYGGLEDDGVGERRPLGPSPQPGSLLRQQFEAAGSVGAVGSSAHDSAGQSASTEQTSLLASQGPELARTISHTPSFSGSQFGQSYGSISRRLTATAQRRASVLIQEHREAALRALEAEDEDKDNADEPKHYVEQEVLPDGEVIERIVGESTVPMTIFNSTNILIGIGILALPLGVSLAGWVIGIAFLTFAAAVTAYTALLLAKCLDTNSAATTYGDVAYLAYGAYGRNFVETLFIVELTAANVAMIILFADSMNSLVPAVSITTWKIIIALGLIPLNFAPFRLLSVTSILGIVSCLGIILIVIIDGFIKPHRPGSLLEVAKTYAFPQNWLGLPLSFGLFMAPWGGHSVIPAIYTDMRHPQKYKRALAYTYTFTYGLDMVMAVVGYLMFGSLVQDEITSNILSSKAYPVPLSIITVALIAAIPITKIALTNRPMMDTINKKLQIDLRQMDPKARAISEVSVSHRLLRSTVAVSLNILQLVLAIAVPSFDAIMALMGSALCFTICVILPLAFYLKIFSYDTNTISLTERIIDWILIIFCGALALIGTVFALLPREKLGIHTSTSTSTAPPIPPNVLAAHRVIQRHAAEIGLPTASLQLRSYSLRNLEFYADFAMRAAYYLGLAARGPNPLPRRRERWTVLRSNFIFKKSQENFERITHKRLITILDGEASAVETWLAFVRKHQFYGVGLKANVWAWEGLDVARDMDARYESSEVKTALEEKMALFGFADTSPLSLPKLIERQGHRGVGAPMANLPWERTPFEEKRALTAKDADDASSEAKGV